MKNTVFIKTVITVLAILLACNGYAASNKMVVGNMVPPKKENPDYDPNKGILGRPKDEKIIKRKEEPILKNRKNEPKRFQK
jgi:hypothetical protein